MSSLTSTDLPTSAEFQRDQASGLRDLMAQTMSWPILAGAQDNPPETTCRSLVVTSGKGGVGKSHYALNMGVALANLGQRVLLIDASEGVSHLELLCGQHSYWNLEHVAAGVRSLHDITIQGPLGVQILTGGRILLRPESIPPALRQQFLSTLIQIEQSFDTLIIDAGTAVFPECRQLMSAADRIDLLTTSEPTAIANTSAAIKHLVGISQSNIGVIVSCCPDQAFAEAVLNIISLTTRTFLQSGVERLGFIDADEYVSQAVISKKPFVLQPNSAAGVQIRRFARDWVERSFISHQSFFRLVLSKIEEIAIT